MTKYFLTFCICFFQLYSIKAEKIQGQIFLKTDTLNVTLDIPIKFLSQEINYTKLQKKVKYYDSNGNKVTLYPHQAIEIKFKYDYENVRMISVPRNGDLASVFDSEPNIFLKLEIDGKLRMYCYYYYQHSPGGMNAATGTMSGGASYSTDKYLLQKENGTIKWPKNLSFRKDMIQYFSDCPELAGKIEKKEFKKDDLDSIVRYYNSNCGSN
ncbi:MAG TPA: hypothetical protein P5145_05495 [Tenuifilaceae bacterium]|nr:hypothetical protein [Tenuifilaceae bacterium]